MEKKELGLGNMEEQQQHLVGYSSNHKKNVIMAKGKRTKRLRLLSSNNNCGVGLGGGASYTYSSANSEDSSSTTTYESSDQEDEDMANCLILLARGGGEGEDSHHPRHHHQRDHPDSNQGDRDNNNNDEDDNKGNCDNKLEKGSNSTNIGTRKFAELATTTNTVVATTTTKVGGFIIYECKTCNRSFPSFQALGGHRASHKKPKLMTSSLEEKKPHPHPQSQPQSQSQPQQKAEPQPQSQPQLQQKAIVTKYDHFEEARQPPHMKTIVPPISLQLEGQSNNTSATRSIFNANKAKIHECSICGSEFSSGQALGGHMRRHRAATTNNNSVVAAAVPAVQVEAAQRRKNILELDLNLPAPEEDLRETKFHQFPATQKSMVLSASPALVDCHY